MLRNPSGEPDVEWEDDAARIEIIEVQPDEMLCAFVVECPPNIQETARKFWNDTIAATSAASMLKFIQNHARD